MDVRFYQFASIFTDVPQLNKQVNKRKWLTNWIEPLLHKKRATFFYLHTLAFLRGNDYFGIYIRLGLIGAFALIFYTEYIRKRCYCIHRPIHDLYATSFSVEIFFGKYYCSIISN